MHARSLTTKIPSNPDRNLARAIDHQRRQQHALGSLLEEIGDRRGPAHPRLADRASQRAQHAQQRPEATAPPVSLRQDDAHASAAPAEDHTEQRADLAIGTLGHVTGFMADLALRHGLVANELRGPMESGVYRSTIGSAS